MDDWLLLVSHCIALALFEGFRESPSTALMKILLLDLISLSEVDCPPLGCKSDYGAQICKRSKGFWSSTTIHFQHGTWITLCFEQMWIFFSFSLVNMERKVSWLPVLAPWSILCKALWFQRKALLRENAGLWMNGGTHEWSKAPDLGLEWKPVTALFAEAFTILTGEPRVCRYLAMRALSINRFMSLDRSSSATIVEWIGGSWSVVFQI